MDTIYNKHNWYNIQTDVLNSSQPQARTKGADEGFEVSIAKTSFKANTKALAENEGEGLAKVSTLVFEIN